MRRQAAAGLSQLGPHSCCRARGARRSPPDGGFSLHRSTCAAYCQGLKFHVELFHADAFQVDEFHVLEFQVEETVPALRPTMQG
jgi:hypothetical protein